MGATANYAHEGNKRGKELEKAQASPFAAGVLERIFKFAWRPPKGEKGRPGQGFPSLILQ